MSNKIIQPIQTASVLHLDNENSSRSKDLKVLHLDFENSSRVKDPRIFKSKIQNEMNETYQGEMYISEDKCIRKGYGIYHYESGDIYEGEWDDNKRCGAGEYIYSDGSIYRGYWKNDKKHGNGTLIAHSLEFEGDWKDDELIDAFVFSINLPDKIDIDETYVCKIESKRKNQILSNNNVVDEKNNKKEDIRNDKISFDYYNDDYENYLIEKLEKKNNEFCTHIELISIISNGENECKEINEKCKESTGLCENCIIKNEGRKIKFNLECNKLKSLARIIRDKLSKL